MKRLFTKLIFFALITALGMAAMPLGSVFAAGENTPPAVAVGQAGTSNERLARIWARQLRIYARIEQGFERDQAFLEKVQTLIDRAEFNGKDISAVQTALEAFEVALKDAHPIYESTKGIVNSHQGFDSAGKVTDTQKAKETVDAMRGKFKEIRAALDGAGRGLHDAVRAYRAANPPAK